ncbi:MAG: DUF1573 domain-containing protein [Planctomycetes bacterium]|nr:DUF1573 domain-containing protein [Planctomycetota bacterium]
MRVATLLRLPSLARAAALLALGSLAVAASVAQADPTLHFGRSSWRQVAVVQGSLATRTVALVNGTAELVHLTQITAEGGAIAVTVVRDRQRFPIELSKPFDMEIPAATQIRLEVAIDAKGGSLGEAKGKVTVTADAAIAGKSTLELPIEWEVVEPPKQDEDELPIPKANPDWAKWTTDGPQPRLECDRYSHDFGKVLSGERLETSFKLKNTGEGDLVIIKVGAQCHCTLSELRLPDRAVSPKELKTKEAYGTLKPGEEATLDCKVDTAGMGGGTHKKVQIYTNDRARSPISIDLVLVVDNPFQFSPASISFGQVRSGQQVERTVRMSSIDQGTFAIVGHDLPQPQVVDIDYKEVPTRRNEQCAWEITLKSRDGLVCDEHIGRLKLALDHERIPTIDQLHYSLRVLPDVEWTIDKRKSPAKLLLGVVQPGVNDVRSLVLENKNPTQPYKVTSAVVTSRIPVDVFATEIVTLEEGQRYEVKFKVIKPPKTKAFAGELEIHAESKTLPLLKLNFSGIWSGNVLPADSATPAAPGGGAPKGR